MDPTGTRSTTVNQHSDTDQCKDTGGSGVYGADRVRAAARDHGHESEFFRIDPELFPDRSGFFSGQVRNFCLLENRAPDRVGTNPDFFPDSPEDFPGKVRDSFVPNFQSGKLSGHIFSPESGSGILPTPL